MVKGYIKRYVALYLAEVPKDLVNHVEELMKDSFGFLFSTKILKIKYIKRMGKIVVLSFHLRNIDPHELIPVLSFLKSEGGWATPLLMSGTIKSLEEGLKERFSELLKG